MTTRPPLRIIHMAATAYGAPWMVAFLREQKRLGHDVAALISSGEGTLGPILEREGIPFYTLPLDVLAGGGSLGAARVLWRVARLLRRLRPDVVQSHIIATVLTARLASWLADVPIRLSMSAGPTSLESNVLGPLEIGTVFADTKTIVSCQYTRDLYIAAGIPPEQIELIYYAVDQRGHAPHLADGARVRRELGIAPQQPTVGIVAYFYPPALSPVMPPQLQGRGIKGHDVLLRAVPGILARVPETKFILVGKGWGPRGPAYEVELHALVDRLGIRDSVIFTGEREDVPDLLASFDVSVHCSLSENLGGTVESLLMARPMVVSRVGGMVDTVRHEETGLLVPPDDPPALADAVVRLLEDRELATRLGENGRSLMLERFTLERTIADLEDLYARMATEVGAGDRPPRRRGYRLLATATRALHLPFRMRGPVREAKRNLFGVAPRASLMRRTSWKIKGVARRILKRESPVATGALRIAQIAGAWENCSWFVDLCRDQADRGHEVIAIIDAQPGNLGNRLTAAGIPWFSVSMTFGLRRDRSRIADYVLRIPLAALLIARILRRERIGVVQSHIFTSVLISRLASAIAGTRHIATIPSPRHLEAFLTRTVDRMTWWLDDVTLAGCHWTRDRYLSLGLNPDRLDSIYYGPDHRRFDPSRADGAAVRRELGIASDSPVVGLVAHFYPPTLGLQTPKHTMGAGLKGHEHFLEAARTIATRFPAVKFILAGAGVGPAGDEYRERLIGSCRGDDLLRDRVIFTGRRNDIPSVLAAIDVAVQCSIVENLGGTIEALLMERPTVATRVGGMPESVRDGETGLLVPPSDPDALADAIIRLLSDREEAAALGRAGRKLMLKHFTFAQMAEDVDAVLRRLARPGMAASAAAATQQ